MKLLKKIKWCNVILISGVTLSVIASFVSLVRNNYLVATYWVSNATFFTVMIGVDNR